MMSATEEQSDETCRSISVDEVKVTELVKELAETRTKLSAALKSVEKAERLYQRTLTYNEDLRKQLDRLSRKLHKYKSKRGDNSDKSTQTSSQDVLPDLNGDPYQSSGKCSGNGDGSTLAQQPGDPSEEKSLSLAESLRQIAQEAVDNTGFVYDETTGLYYDSNSGYFYDHENSLYFDPSSGTYFYYDDETQEYKFHSQVDMTQYYANQSYLRDNAGLHGQQNTKKKRRKRKEEKEENVLSKRRSRKRKKTDDENRDGNAGELMECDKSNQIKCKLKSNSLQSHLETDTELHVVQNSENSDIQHLHENNMELGSIPDEGRESDSESNGSPSDSESELESGELTESESGETGSEEEGDMSGVNEEKESEECNPVNYPPCIRMMVSQSDVVDRGTLYIVTYPGGSIGREGSHVICLPELNVSKVHAEIEYSDSDQSYVIVDRGSQNGTFLNDTRIAEPKCPGDPCILNHGDQLTIGSTLILCHIHAGLETCDLCEPGQVLASLQAQKSPKEEIVILSKKEREKERRKELKNIKKKYGLANVDYIQSERAPQGEGYTDKADERRRTVGSDNPYQKTEAPASIHRPISTTNKGHRMMEKMGWTEGGGLGKSSDGIQEPVKVSFRVNKSAGLGSSLEGKTSLDTAGGGGGRSRENWLKAQQRFNALGAGDSDSEEDAPQGAATPVTSETTGTKVPKPGFQWVQGKTLDLNKSEMAEPRTGQDNS